MIGKDDEHLSTHGYFHELIKDDEFIKECLVSPSAAIAKRKMDWDQRNEERLCIAQQRVADYARNENLGLEQQPVIDYARQVFSEMSVLNFRNCVAGG